MQNLLNDLVELLKQDERFVSEGKLLKNKIIELSLALDPSLLKLLINHEGIKKHFFQDVESVLVFDKVKFQKFVSNKSFFPDSYTSFKNKIGLTTNDEYLTDNNEVILVWPYKDCVLEGGQDKEDAKRNEIFWNETLAPDQIDRLLTPKALNNFKRNDKYGEHSVDKILSTENLIIKGNNLLALHTLKKVIPEKVKLIYIDPPYNTDRDSFEYNDSFKISTWLTFMKNRLSIAKDLLSEDGAIFVQISDVRVGHLKLLLDEVFEAQNFINQITVRTKSPSGFKTVNLGVFETAEYILIYGKNKNKWKYKIQHVKSEYDENYKYQVANLEDNAEEWNIENIEDLISKKHGFLNKKIAKKELGEVAFNSLKASYALENKDSVFRFTEINDDASKETVETRELSKEKPNVVFHIKREKMSDRYVLNGKEIYFYSNKVKEIDGENVPTMLLTNIWNDIAYEGIANEGGVKLKQGKKPEKLLRRIIEMSTVENDLVMDFHLGSGTTCAVAHKLGRQYIGIEQIDYGDNDSVNRIINVINGDQTGVSKLVDWKGGGSFVYCELTKANQYFIDLIQKASTKDTLLEIWNEMQEKAFLAYKIYVQDFDNSISEFEQLELPDQKKFLIETLDKNMLYVPLSEIEDETFAISNDEKKINYNFFKIQN